MPCKDDVCRHESSGGGVTNYETEAENFFVELFQKMRQSYGESVRQMLMEHDGGDFDVEEEKRMLHDMMLSTEILKQKEFHAHDDRAFIHVALTLGDMVAALKLTITYEVRKKRVEACSRHESVCLCKVTTDSERDRRFAYAVNNVKKEGLIKYGYDWTWIELYCEGAIVDSNFSTPTSFLDYLSVLGIDSLPDRSTLAKKMDVVKGEYPNWTFSDSKNASETMRRKRVVGRFIFHYNNFLRQ